MYDIKTLIYFNILNKAPPCKFYFDLYEEYVSLDLEVITRGYCINEYTWYT